MAEVHLTVNISQKALIVIDGKLFLTFEEGQWELPGGRINEGEMDLHEALKREIKEELSSEINSLELFSAALYPNGKGGTNLALVRRCELISPLESIKLQQEEISKWKLFTKEEIKDLDIHDNSKVAIKKFLST